MIGLHTRERVLRSFLLRQHLGRARLVLHGPGDRQLGCIVVVLEDLLVVFSLPVNEHAADDAEFFCLILRNDPFFDAVSHSLGDCVLRGSEHLDSLLVPLDGDLRDHHRCRFDSQVRGQHCQQVRVAVRLVGQGVGKCHADRTSLVTDQQIDVRNFVTIAAQGFADVK